MSASQMKGMFDRVLRNKVRMGNYETKDQDMICIRSLLSFPSENFSIFDPCAGSGRALEVLANETAAVTFAIEPNEQKYMELREKANHALFGGYEECRISLGTFRLMYLNPPYDDDSSNLEDKVERKEKRFLRHLLPYLSTEGILIYNIPRHRMTKDIINILVANLDDIRVYKSIDDTFNQIIAVGRKKSEKYLNRNEVNRILALMEDGSDLNKLSVAAKPLYTVLAGNAEPKLFRSRHIDVELLREISNKSSLTQRAIEWTTPKKPSEKRQPLLPDKEMHRVLRMASGKLNGRVGSGSTLHVLKGIVKKITTEKIEEDGKDQVITEVESFKITFKFVDRYGNIYTIQ